MLSRGAKLKYMSFRIYNVNENEIHFLTLKTVEWIDVFTKSEYFKIIIKSLKYCQKEKGLLIYEYVIMTNHLHFILQVINDFKRFTTNQIWESLKKDNRTYIINVLEESSKKKKGYNRQVWQRENWPVLIYSDKFLEQKINYIHYNPVEKDYVKNPEEWLYSSARNRLSNDDSIISLSNY